MGTLGDVNVTGVQKEESDMDLTKGCMWQRQARRAADLFHSRHFEESAQAYAAILGQTRDTIQPENKALLLMGRAAALFFSAGEGRVAEACQELGEAFGMHPAAARLQFYRLFTEPGAGVAIRTQLRLQAERGLSRYKEAVLSRCDLRSSVGTEHLDCVITQLRALCHLEPDGGGRELRVRLAECLLLRGDFQESLSICNQLAGDRHTYQNTVRVLRGYARLLADDQRGALEDFQAVIEHSAPHPASCVRALCGRGLLRVLADSPYLAALDYSTAARLHAQETSATVRCLVPWNWRGLLCTVLLEQGRVMLEATNTHSRDAAAQETQEGQNSNKEGTLLGVHALACLLVELQPGVDPPQILAVDALYCLGRVEEAHRLLLCLGHTPGRSAVLARLVLLQLHRGFLYDANQLLKKLTQCGDTSCLRPLLVVSRPADRALLQKHCHTAAERILTGRRQRSQLREAVTYLSVAIIASGGGAADSLLARARCYVLLGQSKTAIFDFNAILRQHTKHVAALCGRGFTYLTLNQQKECTRDILAALTVDSQAVTQQILSLEDKSHKLVCDWLHEDCRKSLAELVKSSVVPCGEELLKEIFLIGEALMKMDYREPRWHLIYIDTLIAKGDVKTAGAHLGLIFGQEPRDIQAQARQGVLEAWRRNTLGAVVGLSRVAEQDPNTLDFLLKLIKPAHKKPLAQAAAAEAGCASERGQWEQALCLLTVSVQSDQAGHSLLWRSRATCLARLGLHRRAACDLQHVIQRHGDEDVALRVRDLCTRGHSLLLCSQEEQGLKDFALALEIHPGQSLQRVEAGPGRPTLAEAFLRVAQRQLDERRLSEAWRLVESGLKVDSSHTELRRLKARIKREANGSCIVH